MMRLYAPDFDKTPCARRGLTPGRALLPRMPGSSKTHWIVMQFTKAPAPTPNAPPADVARVAGRGTLYISAAKLWFILSGLGIQITLARLLSNEQFGLYQVVIGIVSVINAVVVTGTSQTVSKYISQDERRADSVKAKALQMQLAVGGGLSVGFFLLAPLIAGYLNDPL